MCLQNDSNFYNELKRNREGYTHPTHMPFMPCSHPVMMKEKQDTN